MDFTIDLFNIVAGSGLLLSALATPWCSALARRPRHTSREDAGDAPSLSVVITAHDNARELEQHLPAILEQHYEGRWEVIVVDESSTDETQDILIRLKQKYSHLYTTFIPESSHYISRKKLALTLGVKASKYDWIVMTDIDCQPHSDEWLSTMAKYADRDKDLVMGYTRFDEETPDYWHYERMLNWCYQTRRMKDATAYRNVGHNLMFRKKAFLDNKGFLQNLVFLRSEYDFIVNELAQEDNCNFVTEEDATMIQECPTEKSWRFSHLYYMASRKQMKRRLHQRMLFNFDQTMLHLGYLLPVGACATACLTGNGLLLIAAVCCLLLTVAIRKIIFAFCCKQYGESISLFKAQWLEIATVWRNLGTMIAYGRSDRYDFIRK